MQSASSQQNKSETGDKYVENPQRRAQVYRDCKKTIYNKSDQLQQLCNDPDLPLTKNFSYVVLTQYDDQLTMHSNNNKVSQRFKQEYGVCLKPE